MIAKGIKRLVPTLFGRVLRHWRRTSSGALSKVILILIDSAGTVAFEVRRLGDS